jgi:hypothetical protein
LKKRKIIVIAVTCVIGVVVYILAARPFHPLKSVPASTILTDDIKSSVNELSFYAGNQQYYINHNDDVVTIYEILQSLTLKKAPNNINDCDGGLFLDILTSQKNISIGMAGDSIFIDGQRYYYNDDHLTETIGDILYKYVK